MVARTTASTRSVSYDEGQLTLGMICFPKLHCFAIANTRCVLFVVSYLEHDINSGCRCYIDKMGHNIGFNLRVTRLSRAAV